MSDRLSDQLIKSIMKAEVVAVDKNIKANAIMLSDHIAFSPEAYACVDGMAIHTPAFVAGLEIKAVGQTLPLDADFIIFHAKDVSPTYQELLTENERLRKQDDKITKILEILEGDNG